VAKSRKPSVELKNHIISVRILGSHLEALEALARVDDTTLGEQIRKALNRYVAKRIRNKNFQKQLLAYKRRMKALLNVLRKKPGD
jgi:hypothetical protein